MQVWGTMLWSSNLNDRITVTLWLITHHVRNQSVCLSSMTKYFCKLKYFFQLWCSEHSKDKWVKGNFNLAYKLTHNWKIRHIGVIWIWLTCFIFRIATVCFAYSWASWSRHLKWFSLHSCALSRLICRISCLFYCAEVRLVYSWQPSKEKQQSTITVF